jgi:hypothetical protein
MQVTSLFELLNLTFLCTTKIHHVEERLKGSRVSPIGVNKVKKDKLFSAVLDTSLATSIENFNIIFLSSIFFLFCTEIKDRCWASHTKEKEKSVERSEKEMLFCKQ